MIYEAIAKLISEHNDCPVEDITEETTFQALGIDSLDTVELLMNLEDTVGREIELDRKVETVGELVRFVESKCEE